MYNILVVYWNNTYPVRTSVMDHLYCFGRYSDHRVHYLNLDSCEAVPSYVERFPFDLIVFHDLFFCGRWGGRELFDRLKQKAAPLKNSHAVKIAIPQDEFIHTDLLCEFINEFSIQHVFSVAPESEWPKIYENVNRERVRIHLVLTGYLDDLTVRRIERLAAAKDTREIDIGYRAGGSNWRQAAWFGRHGLLKIQIADRFNERAPDFALKTDISTRSEDTFLGDDWYRFLLRCKYNVGVEGGASILDRDGNLRAKTLAYVHEHPQASLEEIERNCLSGQEGTLSLFALSPRHLESCAARTCQILVEGVYNGVLSPGIHYLELKKDFSNLEAVLAEVKSDQKSQMIVERAYQDIVRSGRYSYRSFVKEVIETSLQKRTPVLSPSRGSLMYRRSVVNDHRSWAYLILQSWTRELKAQLRPARDWARSWL